MRRRALLDALAGTLLLAVGMGFGRFAFTGLYPQMISDRVLDLHGGALAASANYAGYLVGALLLAWRHPWQPAALCRVGLLGSLACLLAMAVAPDIVSVVPLRFVAGVASALTLVGASLWLLRGDHHPQAAPLLYGGVGLGILLSAELIAAGQALGGHSHFLWLLLAVAAALLGLPALRALGPTTPTLVSEPLAPPAPALPTGRLVGLYGLAGFGYIITATYLPLLLQGGPVAVAPLQLWAAFGLGAAPSCFLWHNLRERLGTRRALTLNLGLQAVGVALPALDASAGTCLLSALLVGSTFMGTVTIAMAAARAESAHKPHLAAWMTASYGLGQIAGPLLASALHGHYQHFAPALLSAAGALALAALLSLPLRRAPAT
ncbi:YbfB/YjiJ family MFS transporter [Pseudomonas sp. Gutcm_11s]|uniref:YbfB/YjiJ family MFS transporter n=1 Tax=Pseudomonas sp. Gutcm_11s TaxID=3026088 RepID=UPI00235FE1E2|nr:YbfB/YjiJ family MFS transporter [Pseudomonas sp. Gutcm_11s]MDD0845251.1 YbfB/YjiJ family MFS transporter [Pseudomonas sp. Gutcm_11s]